MPRQSCLGRCTTRGIDFEYLRKRKAESSKQATFSTLGSDEDARKVLKYPQLVLDGDWAQLFDLTGVRLRPTRAATPPRPTPLTAVPICVRSAQTPSGSRSSRSA